MAESKPSPMKYIVLYSGCDTDDIVYCDNRNEAYLKLAKMNMKKECRYNEPRIEVYKRNEKGEYLPTNEIIFSDDVFKKIM